MKTKFLLVTGALFLTCPIFAKGGITLFGGGPSAGSVAFTYGLATLEEDTVKPDAIEDFDKAQFYALAFDIGRPIGFHFAIKHMNDRSTNINFDNAGVKRGEIYYSTVDLGIDIYLPFGFFQPFVKGGGSLGFMAVSDPTNRKAHGFTAAFGRETSGIRGLFASAGLDIWFGKWGIRGEGRHDMVETNSYHNLEGKGVDFRSNSFLVSLIFGEAGK